MLRRVSHFWSGRSANYLEHSATRAFYKRQLRLFLLVGIKFLKSFLGDNMQREKSFFSDGFMVIIWLPLYTSAPPK